MSEKIQKVLAHLGVASRREIEKWIVAGRIVVNGKPAQLGDRMTDTAKVLVDGRPVRVQPERAPRRRVLVYHKTEHEISTRKDPEGRPTVFDHLPVLRGQRWIAIGRLDINTSGLLLFTNDGELANRLMHPSYEIEREYAVRILGNVDPMMIRRLKEGVQLDDGLASFTDVIDGGGTGANHWYNVILKEGRNREVRRLWESQGVKVSRLMRVRFADITLPRSVRPGKCQDLETQEINGLLEKVGLLKK